jgi:hypothetical protein
MRERRRKKRLNMKNIESNIGKHNRKHVHQKPHNTIIKT